MKSYARGLLAVLLLASTALFASSIPDPGVKLGPGAVTTYNAYAEVVSLPNGDFQLLFDGQPFDFTNPFAALGDFCFNINPDTSSAGIECFFENDSNVAITTATQAFVTAFDPGQLSCLNAFTGGECDVGGTNNNIVSFTNFFVPTASDWIVGGDSGFNLSYIPTSSGGFTEQTAEIASFLLNGKQVLPEPSSLSILLVGLPGMWWLRRRKVRKSN